mmetsp:Transcript_24826/g.44648  ORF Transcript_24826/g.44648 Transcript_24826/m.44648 type:complete len:146 (-) Transcript_24826:100-537(-)|eukprot:CAMPEP_0201886912 /NCGR_PEP_ID=MMETSP0902-20130614/23553_1 /ASSEMBLY_ACC=CAM_ASM_000551 /TAXON_ID=420261 /ORGANISM="Thalassiosira antarctica, Strain CCMP982" /LENGTH=145 /DNA_ID=CAMNT_0048416673 /DNA_START=168 /DNA_END=605 /DNA_ORIENTATION=-
MEPNTKIEPAESAASYAALFQNGGDTSLAEGFKDKVAALHSHFDRDGDGYLKHSELRGLQLVTSGEDMQTHLYMLVCQSVGCDPRTGLSLDELKLVYASDGADIEEDYLKVFPKKETKKNKEELSNAGDDDDVLEVGENGVDISN